MLCVSLGEVLYDDGTIPVKAVLQVAPPDSRLREVEVYHLEPPFQARGVVLYPQAVEQAVEPPLARHVVVVTQHAQEHALPEPTGADQEQEVPHVLQLGDVHALVHAVPVLGSQVLKIRYAVRQSLHFSHGLIVLFFSANVREKSAYPNVLTTLVNGVPIFRRTYSRINLPISFAPCIGSRLPFTRGTTHIYNR